MTKHQAVMPNSFSLAIAGLKVPLSRFLEGALYKYPERMNEWVKTSLNSLQLERSLHLGESCSHGLYVMRRAR